MSNPYFFEQNENFYLGTSGLNIDNMMKNHPFSDSALEYLKYTLIFNHIAPTAPEKLK